MATYHTVKQGESLSSLAKKYQFTDYRTIYDHPQNEKFFGQKGAKKRPSPNILNPGWRLYIPDKQEKQESRGTERHHRFQVRQEKTLLRLLVVRLVENAGKYEEQPLANEPYRLKVDDHTFRDRTDRQGVLEHEIPADAQQGWLYFDQFDLVWELKLGHLDPSETVPGRQARLVNLGFDCGEVDGQMGPRTRETTRQFQAKQLLSPSRKEDPVTPETLERLEQQHDRFWLPPRTIIVNQAR